MHTFMKQTCLRLFTGSCPRQYNWLLTFTANLSKIVFNIIITSTPTSSK